MEPKPNGNCIIAGLPTDQKARVDAWLFDENRTYREVVERCANELNVSLTLASVGRYYSREYECRAAEQFSRTADQQRAALNVFASHDTGEKGYAMLLQMAVHVAGEEMLKPASSRDFRKIGCLLRALTAARREASEALRASTMREKFEFDVATACLVHKVRMDAITRDESTNDTDKILKIREQLFGPNLPE